MEEKKLKFKGGRPAKNKEETRKFKETTVGFTKKEHEIIQEKAKKLNCTISEYMRQSALDVKILEKRDVKELIDVRRELNIIGANINQITRKMNQNIQMNQSLLRYDIDKLISRLIDLERKYEG